MLNAHAHLVRASYHSLQQLSDTTPNFMNTQPIDSLFSETSEDNQTNLYVISEKCASIKSTKFHLFIYFRK